MKGEKDSATGKGAKGGPGELRNMINMAQKVTEQLLALCNTELQGKPVRVSLRREFNFKHGIAPCPLVIPLQSALTATLPSASNTSVGSVKTHMPFSSDSPTIEGKQF